MPAPSPPKPHQFAGRKALPPCCNGSPQNRTDGLRRAGKPKATDHTDLPELWHKAWLRDSKRGAFWGCPTYPKCRGSWRCHAKTDTTDSGMSTARPLRRKRFQSRSPQCQPSCSPRLRLLHRRSTDASRTAASLTPTPHVTDPRSSRGTNQCNGRPAPRADRGRRRLRESYADRGGQAQYREAHGPANRRNAFGRATGSFTLPTESLRGRARMVTPIGLAPGLTPKMLNVDATLSNCAAPDMNQRYHGTFLRSIAKTEPGAWPVARSEWGLGQQCLPMFRPCCGAD